MADTAPTTRDATGTVTVTSGTIYRRVRRERLTYAAGTAAIAVTPQFPGLWPAHAAVGAAAAGGIAWLWDKSKTGDHLGLLTTAQRSVPLLTGAGVYFTNLFSAGMPWWEAAAAAAWGAAMSWLAPVTRAAGLTLELPELPAQAPAALTAAPVTGENPATGYADHLARQWDASGIAPGTRLVAITPYDPARPDFQAVIVAQTGKAVPTLSDTALAAAFDFPPGTVTTAPVPGSGPGRLHLTATPTLNAQTQQASDPVHRIWNEKITNPRGAAPGMILADYRIEPNRIALLVTAPEGQLIHLDQKQIARGFDYKDTSLVMIETDGLGDGVISLYQTHPLMQVREATATDLTMAPDGTIQIGIRPDGRAARMPLYDPQMGAVTDLFVGAPGAGKSVTLNTVLAAERISGIVSIVADAQDGMSLPEADGRVYHFGKGIAATAATLAAFNDLGKYREKVSAANGWGSFEIGKPWRLVNGTFDELNRILSEDADVPRPFRKWVTGMVGDAQSTGRKLGKGIRFAAQSIHLADLGDKDRIRANAKNGTVWLGRTNSSTTQHMATDGVIPAGITLEPIPRHFNTGGTDTITAAFHGKDTPKGPITAGMANIIQSGSVFLSRTFSAAKVNKTYPGLIALYESAPIPTLTPQEHRVFQESYAQWLPYAESLLAGEDTDTDETGEDPYTGDTDYLAPDTTPTTPTPGGTTVRDRILAVLTGGPLHIKDIRARLADVSPGTVNNVIGQLREEGEVQGVSRGVYQLPN